MKGRNGVCRSSGEHPPNNESAGLADALAELVEQPRFADAGLAGDVDHLDTAAGLRQASFQRLKLAVAPDIGSKAAAQRCIEARGAVADGLEPIGFLRLGLAFDLMLAREARLDHALHQAIGRLGHAYRTRLGQRLESRRYIHCVAENRNARIGATLHAAHHRRSGIDSDAQLRPHAMLGLEIAPGGFQPLQN
jgi:hypothetical protein